MRPEFDSQIDSVLRGHARRGGAASSAWGDRLRPSISDGVASGSHLDADEIAAFGENALPAVARARYAAHLADCDDCRRSVAQVALAAGIGDRIEGREPGKVEAATVKESPSWRERLAAVFAPRAWRYAMPVVALIAVSAVVLVVTRRLPREEAMTTEARRANAEQQASAPAAPEVHHADATQPQPSETAKTETGNAGMAGIRPTTGEARGAGASDEVEKQGSKAADAVGQSAVGGSAGTVSERQEVAQKVQNSPAPPATESYTAAAPPPAPPAAAPRAMVLQDDVPKPTPAAERAEVVTADRAREESRGATVPRDEEPATKRHGPQRGVREAELSSAAETSKDNRTLRRARAGQSNSAEANRNAPDEAKARREEDREQQAETRTVGGRRFRREGNVWIDTAFKASQSTVIVRAGSEQYRALVADEPEIGRISRALGGEVVIVWKGRAYRVKP